LIRQDKITFLISTLQSPELYSSLISNEFVHHNKFNVPNYIDRIFKRIGIISKFENNSSKILTQYIPVNKHKFLKESLLKFSEDYCLKNTPICKKCYISSCCDYNNKRNNWIK